MDVKYLNTKISNTTGGCYDWSVQFGNKKFTGALDEAKRWFMTQTCLKVERRKKKTT
jgi:hypothetical protein